MITYPFPLSDGRFAYVYLPDEQVTRADADRMVAYLAAITVEPARLSAAEEEK